MDSLFQVRVNEKVGTSNSFFVSIARGKIGFELYDWGRLRKV
jgi:hypothetical protein